MPVSYALLFVGSSDGVVDRRCQLVDPGREIPPEATVVHGITTEQARRGQPLGEALAEVTEVLLTASRQRIPVAGVKRLLRSHHRRRPEPAVRRFGASAVVAGPDPCSTRSSSTDESDRFRRGRRTLTHLCAHYNIGLRKPHERRGLC